MKTVLTTWYAKKNNTWGQVAINRRGKYPQGEIAPYLRDSSGFLQESFHLILSEDHIHGRPAGKRGGGKQVSFFTTLEVQHPRLDCFSERVQETRVSKKIPFSKLRLDSNLINRISDQSKSHWSVTRGELDLWYCPKKTMAALGMAHLQGLSFLIYLFSLYWFQVMLEP